MNPTGGAFVNGATLFERMNFFSHAVVAGRFSRDPVFVLGAMLPDFASMLGVRMRSVAEATIRNGVRFHHLTDGVFHELPVFRTLSRDANSALRDRGVARGPALAIAHVGIEILLDTTLGQSAAARDAYLSGLEAGRTPAFARSLAWPEPEAKRLADLLETLVRRGIVLDTSSELLVERIRRTLAGRPRLRLGPDDPPRVRDWVEATRDRVVGSTPALVAELHRELERRFPSGEHP
jgi:hypothetical protein